MEKRVKPPFGSVVSHMPTISYTAFGCNNCLPPASTFSNSLNTGIDTISAKMEIQQKRLLPNRTVLVELPNNHIYLVSVLNTYNVGSLFIVQTGAEVSGACKIDVIVESNHFIPEPVSKTSFNIKIETADGYLNALQLDF